MKLGISIYGGGRLIPSNIFPSHGADYGKEVIGTAYGFGGSFVQFRPDISDTIYTLPTNYEWILIRVIQIEKDS